jgi:hypothetical protein
MMNRLQFSEYQDFYIWHEYCLALNKQKHKNSSKERENMIVYLSRTLITGGDFDGIR